MDNVSKGFTLVCMGILAIPLFMGLYFTFYPDYEIKAIDQMKVKGDVNGLKGFLKSDDHANINGSSIKVSVYAANSLAEVLEKKNDIDGLKELLKSNGNTKAAEALTNILKNKKDTKGLEELLHNESSCYHAAEALVKLVGLEKTTNIAYSVLKEENSTNLEVHYNLTNNQALKNAAKIWYNKKYSESSDSSSPSSKNGQSTTYTYKKVYVIR